MLIVQDLVGFPRSSATPSSRVLAVASLLLSAGLLLAGCATTLPKGYERASSTAFPRPDHTELGRFFQAELATHPGKSGVALVPTGEWGFRARSGLAHMAEKTLDVQYYIWESDTTGKILAERLIRAADRGVRVRMLLDDVYTSSTDFQLGQIDRHPNIEIRLFNPFVNRQARISEFLFNIERLNHRMHNKAFIADNAIAIVGGRNIADVYFGVDTAANFRDLELAVVGPVVQDVSQSFDTYWNSQWAVPVRAVIPQESSDQEIQASKAKLFRWVENQKDFPYPIHKPREEMFAKLEELRGNFVWARAMVLSDAPDKIESGEEEVVTRLIGEGKEKENELVLETAYLIAGPRGVALARLNKEKGIRQRALTNSLATNDVAAAHAGYAKFRKDLIRNGVELYELRPDAEPIKRKWSLLAGKSTASLHTKAIVSDREKVFIGSFNPDPRSIAINTELVIFVESPELASQVIEHMDQGVHPDNSYRVILEPNERGDGERLVWITERNGEEVRYYSDPDVGLWRRFSVWFLSLLPIEKHL
ncbi:MAG: phospholipase D family protein [Pseudomonadota bacterium]|nr:phospholipase D family protein [Pseudomonadota bacterium]